METSKASFDLETLKVSLRWCIYKTNRYYGFYEKKYIYYPCFIPETCI